MALWYGRVVGGGSATPPTERFHEIDFIERSRLGAIHGTGLADWPITYADLRAVLHQVDWEIGVSGLAGADPFDPPRTKGYPMPPLPVKSSGVLFERGARKLGWHPVPSPMAISCSPTAAGRLRPLRVLSRLRLRGARQSVHGDDRHSGSGCDGSLRSRAESYVARITTNKQQGRHRRGLLRSRQARTSSTGSCRCRVRQWSGDAEAPPDVRERRVSERPGELGWARRQVP